jgi:hypothetical protein
MFDSAKQYELLIRPLGRRPADEYYHNGSIWIEGREGNNYTIDLTNRSHQRALFILSVDGLDVLEGKPAGLNSQGYVIASGQTISVPGWKLNNNQAAEFYFSRSRDSYVNSIGGSTTNTGVIGAMVFQEYQEIPSVFSDVATVFPHNGHPGVSASWVYSSVANNTAIRAAAVQAATANTGNLQQTLNTPELNYRQVANLNYVSQEVGTGFGKATDWETVTTQFRRNNPTQPDAIMVIYYNTAKNLEKMGIKLHKKHDVQYKADPFPAYSSSAFSTGCATPPGWKP